MECRSVHKQLNILSDGERLAGPAVYLAVTRHCLTCPACRSIARRLRRDRSDARDLAHTPVPAALKARVMASLPTDGTAAVPVRSVARPVLRAAARVAVGVGLAAALLTAVPWRGSRSMAAEVAAAVERANTWHLKGWKLRDGQRLPWEIWGRRRPYFYREQAGQEFILDDGRQRTQCLLTWSGGERLFAIRMASREGADEVSWSPLTMAEPWRDVRPTAQTPEAVQFQFPESDSAEPGRHAERRYRIDRRTWLPTRYEWRHDIGGREWVAETLDAEYDVPLPADVAALRPPPDLPVVDGLTPAAPGSLPRENTVSDRGLTAQLSPLAIDPEGNILAKVRGWLGNRQLGVGDPPILFTVDAPSWYRDGWVTPEPFRTDDGRVYVQVFTYSHGGSDSERLVLLAPLEPLSRGVPLPRALTATLSVSPQVMGVVSAAKRQLMSKHLFVQDLTWTVRLPDRPSTIDLVRDDDFVSALAQARADRKRMGAAHP